MSKRNKSNVDLNVDLEMLRSTLDSYVSGVNIEDEEIHYTASLFLNWLNTKTILINNEKLFKKPDNINIRRGSVVWVDFGFNIGDEFGGKHPAIILKVSGKKAFVLPLSSKTPKNPNEPMYVKVENVKRFKNMVRWGNVLNITGVSIQRIDFSNIPGSVKGEVLDEISNSIKIAGVR